MLNIKNKIEFENNLFVGEIDASFANSSQENRIKFVTDIASITLGRLGQHYKEEEFTDIICKRRENLYNKLLTESANKPSVPFEFVPCVYPFKNNETKISDTDFNKYFRYGYSENQKNYTNMRNILNLGHDVDKWLITDIEDLQNFKIIVGRVPMKVISHLRTHRAFSWLVESSRNKRYLDNVEFWYPNWWNKNDKDRIKEIDEDRLKDLEEAITNRVFKPEEATMELSDRRLVYFAMAAWKQDTNAWDNLFAVRGYKTGTMNITEQTVNNIKSLINGT